MKSLFLVVMHGTLSSCRVPKCSNAIVPSIALFELCIIPILLYGCENCVLTPSLLAQLEAFQERLEEEF